MSILLAQELAALRRLRGSTLGQLAARTGIPKSTLSRWEAGVFAPRAEGLGLLLNELKARPEDRIRIFELLNRPAAWQDLGLPAATPGGTCLGDVLRGLRLRRGWPQAYLANELGVQISAVSRWESGDLEPSPEMKGRLARLFGFSDAEAAIATGAAGESVRAEIARMRSPAQAEALFDDDAESDENVRMLRYLTILHSVGLRAAVDPGWRDSHLSLANAYAERLMHMHRDNELLELSLGAGRVITQEFRDDPRSEWFRVARFVAESRVYPKRRGKLVKRLLDLTDALSPAMSTWCQMTAGGLATWAPDHDLALRILDTLLASMAPEHVLGLYGPTLAVYYRHAKSPESAVRIVESSLSCAAAQRTPNVDAGYDIQLLLEGALAHGEMGDRAEAARFIGQAEKLGEALTAAGHGVTVASRFDWVKHDRQTLGI